MGLFLFLDILEKASGLKMTMHFYADRKYMLKRVKSTRCYPWTLSLLSAFILSWDTYSILFKKSVYIILKFFPFKNISNFNLNNYFRLHVCLSFSFFVCHTLQFPIPAALQNVTNKGYLLCVEIEKHVFWVTLRP